MGLAVQASRGHTEPMSKPVDPRCLRVEPASKVLRGLPPMAHAALAHWKRFQPRLVQELEATGLLRESLQRAVSQTEEALEQTEKDILKQGCSEEQAERTAMELVQGEWLFPPQEIPEHERKDRNPYAG